MKRVLAILALQISTGAALVGCAPASFTGGDSGGPTFIQMPLSQQSLVGATPQLLNAAFGQPALLRVDGTAQVWLYHASDCGLNLILYPDNAGTPRVTMAAPTDNGADTAACSATLQRAHAQSAQLQPAQAQPEAAQAAATPSNIAQPAILPAAIDIAAPPPVLTPATAPPPSDSGQAGAATDGLERASSS